LSGTRLGMLTPSSNTVLEPMTHAILSGLDGVTAHFSRFHVTEISLSQQALGQFEFDPIIQAARLLADAKVDAIAWNGTSGGWRGFAFERELCRRIEHETGIPATTCTLALLEILERTKARALGWATPYVDEIQDKILQTFGAAGFTCKAERHLRDRGNFSFGEISEERIDEMLREVVAERPDAAIIFCTNLRGAGLVDRLEQEFDVPIYDSVAITVWKSLLLAGVDPGRIRGWGRLFSLGAGEVG
jgi:maleate isomerase